MAEAKKYINNVIILAASTAVSLGLMITIL